MDFYIQNKLAIEQYFRNGCKHDEGNLVGVELEHFLLYDKTEQPVTYYGETGVESLLSALEPKFSESRRMEGRLIALGREKCAISLEPAGQFECSLGPTRGVAPLEKLYSALSADLAPLLAQKGEKLVCVGYRPHGKVADLPLIPKERYRLMDARFARVGTCGINMMRGTASTQVSLDYVSEEEARELYLWASAISPSLALLTDNCKYFEGERYKKRMLRSYIWANVDDARCNFVAEAFREGSFFQNYAEYILNTPLILKMQDGKAVGTGDKTTAEVYADHVMGQDEVEHALSMVFPHVRLKNYVEIRIADSLPIELALGFTALLYYSNTPYFRRRVLSQSDLSAQTLAEDLKTVAEHGYEARDGLHTPPPARLLDEMLAEARSRATGRDRELLEYVAPYIVERKSVREQLPASLPKLYADYERAVAEAGEDNATGWENMKKYLKTCTALSNSGRHLDATYMPKLFSGSAVRALRQAAETTYSIMDRVTKEYLANPEYRKLFPFSKSLEELILTESGYACSIPICRADIFFDEKDYSFRFCEINTDGASAMNEDRELQTAIHHTPAWHIFKKRHPNCGSFELFDSWVDTLLKLASEAGKNNPTVAIADFMESGTKNEFTVFKHRFEKRGIRCFICEIRDLKYQNGKLLTKNGEAIDVIYRRAVTQECMEKSEQIRDFLQAVRERAVVLVGAFRTQVVHNKEFFIIARHPMTQAILSEEQNRFVERTIPRTALLDDCIEETLANREKLLIKPTDRYGSTGVVCGADCTDEEWLNAVRQAHGNSYVVQEYCRPMQTHNIWFEDGQQREATFNNMTGMFIYGGKLAGLYSRLVTSRVTSHRDEGRVAPSVFCDKNADGTH